MKLNRRQLLGLSLSSLLAGCSSEVNVRQPTATLQAVEQYGSDKNIKVTVKSKRYDRAGCSFQVAGTFSDIQWPTADVRVILFLYDERGIVLTSHERLFEQVVPGDVLEFKFDVPVPDCRVVAGYEVVGRRSARYRR